jgi:WD40 repeat protein
VRVWDVKSGNTVARLTNFNGSVKIVAWSPDGKYLAAASIAPSDTLHVWQLTQTQSQSVLTADPPGKADSVAWSHDGTRLAVGIGGLSNTSGGVSNSAVRIYDTKRWQVVATMPYTYYLLSVTWSPDDKHIAFGSSTVTLSDNSLVVWDVDKGQQPQALHYFPNKQNTINSVAWSPTSDHLIAASSNDGTVGIWDIAAGKRVATLVQGGYVVDVAWSPDGKRLASASENDTAMVWDASSGTLLKTFALLLFANAVAWSPDGKLLAVGVMMKLFGYGMLDS